MCALTVAHMMLQDIYSRVARLVSERVDQDAARGSKLAAGVQGVVRALPESSLLTCLSMQASQQVVAHGRESSSS